MSTFRIALANLPFPATPEESIASAVQAIAAAATKADGAFILGTERVVWLKMGCVFSPFWVRPTLDCHNSILEETGGALNAVVEAKLLP